jgi:hypothetical protein
MVDLIVDASLDDTNRDLKSILDEFKNCEKNAQEDQNIWGQSDVASAMHDFAHNWYVHRDAIQSRLSKLSDRVDKACSTWSDADKQLSDSLQVNNSQQGGSLWRSRSRSKRGPSRPAGPSRIGRMWLLPAKGEGGGACFRSSSRSMTPTRSKSNE